MLTKIISTRYSRSKSLPTPVTSVPNPFQLIVGLLKEEAKNCLSNLLYTRQKQRIQYMIPVFESIKTMAPTAAEKDIRAIAEHLEHAILQDRRWDGIRHQLVSLFLSQYRLTSEEKSREKAISLHIQPDPLTVTYP